MFRKDAGTLLPQLLVRRKIRFVFLVEKHGRMCHNKSDGYRLERMIQRNPAGRNRCNNEGRTVRGSASRKRETRQAETDVTTKAERYEGEGTGRFKAAEVQNQVVEETGMKEGTGKDSPVMGKWRPSRHFTVKSGWINDPNGLIFYKGQYHLFYQYNPYSTVWETMHWGHAVSSDLIHWEELPCALIPDQPYEKDPEGGCFSGSVVIHDDKMHLIYTGTTTEGERPIQVQCLAVSEDGIHFDKYANNPVIAQAPAGCGGDFRDPKVFRAEGKWRMICGGSDGRSGDPSSNGMVYLYCSEDLIHWEYQGILYRSDDCSMFECPDLFPLGDKWVLTASPMNRPDFAPNIWVAGSVDFENCRFTPEREGVIDHGTHFYAAQTYPDGHGGMHTTAWLGGWFWMPWYKDHGPLGEEGARGILVYPRTVTQDAEGFPRWLPNERFPEPAYQEKEDGIIYEEMDGPFTCSAVCPSGRNICLTLHEGEGKKVTFTVDMQNGTMTADYTNADENAQYGVRICSFDPAAAGNSVRLDRDGCVITLILGDGGFQYTTLLYPPTRRITVEVSQQ